jgi:hypothetical protein
VNRADTNDKNPPQLCPVCGDTPKKIEEHVPVHAGIDNMLVVCYCRAHFVSGMRGPVNGQQMAEQLVCEVLDVLRDAKEIRDRLPRKVVDEATKRVRRRATRQLGLVGVGVGGSVGTIPMTSPKRLFRVSVRFAHLS